MGRRVPNRNHPDYFPLRMATEIFGGYFGSRLMKNVREEKGLTYGISASMSMLRETGCLIIGADVNLELFEQAITEINSEMRRLHTEPVP